MNKAEGRIETGRLVIQAEAEALQNLTGMLGVEFENAVQMILECPGRVIFLGIGKAGHIAEKLAATFASTGTPAFFVHPAEAAHGDLGMITANDLVITLSHSGASDEVVNLLPIIKKFGVKLIAITSRGDSPIASAADLTLLTFVDREADPRGQAPTSSAVAMLALGDAIAISTSVARGFTREDFLRFHPGGALGRNK